MPIARTNAASKRNYTESIPIRVSGFDRRAEFARLSFDISGK